jgi:lysophospholipase L1-like esterase
VNRRPASVAVAIFAAATVAALMALGQVAAPGGNRPTIPGPAPSADAPTAAGTTTATATSPAAPKPTADPEAFAGLKILLLGDSLAAGEGGGNYVNGTDEPRQRCHRSAAGWFALTAADITNRGCSRAIIRHLMTPQSDQQYNARPEPAQLDGVAGQAQDLTVVMLGGNDLRFAEIFNQCVLSDDDCTSDSQFTARAFRSASSLPNALADAYRTVADHVGPRAVLVPAYPQLFGDATGDCGRISPAEAKFARDLIAVLNRSIRAAAESAGESHPSIRFVPDTEAALSGHGACDPEPYVHTVLPTALIGAVQEESAAQELLHPNAAGYARLTGVLAGWLAKNPSAPTIAP